MKTMPYISSLSFKPKTYLRNHEKGQIAGLFQQFFNSEKAGGLILIVCTAISLLIANSSFGPDFIHFWHIEAPLQIGRIHIPFRIEEWINDGLMTIFFLLVGLEIETRTLYRGIILL